MTTLSTWERGIAVQAAQQRDMLLHLWFYEWNMFDAVSKGQHTRGRSDFPWETSADGRRARTTAFGFTVEAQAVADGAELSLTVTNETDYPWPEVAGIIPCFNPGKEGQTSAENRQFLDEQHNRTYFWGRDGLALLQDREIHFNDRLRPAVDRLRGGEPPLTRLPLHASRQRLHRAAGTHKTGTGATPGGEFVFSHKWPASAENAVGGILIRESADRRWVGAIAWDRFLSAQGHNPWRCMHLGIQVGPLAPAESRTVRGKIYLFEGTKQACLDRYRDEFALSL